MPLIERDGLFHGDRMARLSLMARLHWPFLFCLSNDFGRIEINYPKIAKEFSTFDRIPTQTEVFSYFHEYFREHLIFLYHHEGAVWGQFETSEKFLKKYKDAASIRSPQPNPEALNQWRDQYQHTKKERTSDNGISLFEKLTKKVPFFIDDIGEGVGVGVGGGVGKELNPSSTEAFALETQTPDLASRKQKRTNQPDIRDRWFHEEIWPNVWRKVDKADALKAFKKNCNRESEKDVIAVRTKQWGAYYSQRDSEHQPHYATWLSKGRHLEDPPDHVPGKSSSGNTAAELAEL